MRDSTETSVVSTAPVESHVTKSSHDQLEDALVESHVTKSSHGQKRKIEQIYGDSPNLSPPQSPKNSSLEVLSDIFEDSQDLIDSPFQLLNYGDNAQILPLLDLSNVTVTASLTTLNTQVTPCTSPIVPKNLFSCAASPSFGNGYSTPEFPHFMHTSVRFSSPLTPSKLPKKMYT